MSERDAYVSMRNGIRRPRDRIERMENVVGLGWPDVNCCFAPGIEVWIEIKSPKEPKRAKTPLFGSNHPLSQEQKNWFLSQRQAGGKAFIYIETATRRMLVPAEFADGLNEMSVPELLSASCWSAMRPTTREDWILLRYKLVTHYAK